MKNFLKENLYWIILALVFALIFWLAPKVNATPLDDFIRDHNLIFPQIVKEQMKEQDLVAAAGMLNEKEQIFIVYFLPKQDLPANEIQIIDFSKVVVEYITYKTSLQPAKIWTGNHRERVYVFLELWDL